MKELMDSVLEFFKDNFGDNYIWVIAGAGALVLLILIAAIVSASKKKAVESEAEEPREFFLEGEYDTMLKDAAHAHRTEKAALHEEHETVAEATREEQEALKEELQQVHINISIERGQVHIGYEEDGKVTCIVEAEDEAAAEAEPADIASFVKQAPEPEKPEGGQEVLAGQNIILEKINLVKASPAKKFGPDNFNTGRSGRVFTEEELREQIKQ